VCLWWFMISFPIQSLFRHLKHNNKRTASLAKTKTTQSLCSAFHYYSGHRWRTAAWHGGGATHTQSLSPWTPSLLQITRAVTLVHTVSWCYCHTLLAPHIALTTDTEKSSYSLVPLKKYIETYSCYYSLTEKCSTGSPNSASCPLLIHPTTAK